MSEIMLGVLRMPADLFWADDPVLRQQHDAIRLEAAAEIERLTAIVRELPHKDDIDVALRANGGNSLEDHETYCECDPDVGCVPCRYCVIHSVLARVMRAAAEAEREGIDERPD